MENELKTHARRFYWILCVVFLVYASVAWFQHAHNRALIFLALSIFLPCFHMTFSGLSITIFQAQKWLISKIGTLITTLFLVAFFYFIFTPYGFLIRLFQTQILPMGFDQKQKSYWIYRSESDNQDKTCESPF